MSPIHERPRRGRLLLPLLLLSAVAAPGRADDDAFEHIRKNTEPELRFDESLVEPWREVKAKWPPMPDDDQLIRLEVDSAPPGLAVYVAPASVSVDPDRVSRYWLVLKSDQGGYNAIYQGLRCSALEYKNYAFGNPRRDPPVREYQGAAWQPLSSGGSDRYLVELARDYFCYDGTPRKVDRVRDALASKEGTRQAPFIP